MAVRVYRVQSARKLGIGKEIANADNDWDSNHKADTLHDDISLPWKVHPMPQH